MSTALDSNILIAVLNGEPTAEPVTSRLNDLRQQGDLVICGAVYAELLAGRGVTPDFLQDMLRHTGITLDPHTDLPLWTASGAAYARYAERRRRGTGEAPRRILADYLIGAHARQCASRLFTLDPDRYRKDFPDLELVTVEG